MTFVDPNINLCSPNDCWPGTHEQKICSIQNFFRHPSSHIMKAPYLLLSRNSSRKSLSLSLRMFWYFKTYTVGNLHSNSNIRPRLESRQNAAPSNTETYQKAGGCQLCQLLKYRYSLVNSLPDACYHSFFPLLGLLFYLGQGHCTVGLSATIQKEESIESDCFELL